jgi:hypothetical protein
LLYHQPDHLRNLHDCLKLASDESESRRNDGGNNISDGGLEGAADTAQCNLDLRYDDFSYINGELARWIELLVYSGMNRVRF